MTFQISKLDTLGGGGWASVKELLINADLVGTRDTAPHV